jgi:hypothetical protein
LKVTTKYEDEDGNIHPIRLNSTHSAVAGTPPSGAVDSDISAKVSKSSRAYGLRPRGVRLSRIVGTSPDQFKRYSFLPVLTPTALAGSGFNIGSTITIDSVAWTVAKRVAEDMD